MSNTEEQAIKVVEELNAECSTPNITPFSFASDGYSSGVKFLGNCIWDTENHSMYDHDDNEIDLELYIRNEAKKILKEIKKFKL